MRTWREVRNFASQKLVLRPKSEIIPRTEPYQPHSIPPNWGGTLCQEPKMQFRHHLPTQRKLRPPNWDMKY